MLLQRRKGMKLFDTFRREEILIRQRNLFIPAVTRMRGGRSGMQRGSRRRG